MTMKTSDFAFDLPEELIAQDPLEDRSSSRLMLLDKNTGEISHRIFHEITSFLRAGDCLVINDTKVIKNIFDVARNVIPIICQCFFSFFVIIDTIIVYF